MKTGKSANVFFRLACFLLVVTSFTCVALARYVSSARLPSDVGIANFACSIKLNVDRTDSTYSFFNSEYQINGIEMNTTQSTGFTVNNCNLLDGGYSDPCEVDLKYELVFYIPQEFARHAGIQLSKPATTNDLTGEVTEETAATPFYKLSSFLGEATTVTANASYSETITVEGTTTTVTYGSLPYRADEMFTRSGDGITREWTTADGVSILIEEVDLPAEVRYTFQCFNHKPDPEAQDLSTLKRLAPIYLSREDALKFYKIRISRPEFVLGQGEQVDHNYNLRTVLMESFKQEDTTNEHGQSFSELLKEDIDSLTRNDKPCTVVKNEVAGPSMYTITIEGEEPQDAYIDTFVQKDYPIRLNAVFTQTKLTTAES